MRGTVPRAADPVRAAYLVLVSLLLASCLPSAEGQQPGPEKAEQDRPNVVLVVTDDLAARDLNPQTLKAMPNIRSLAEGGTTFENAFAPFII